MTWNRWEDIYRRILLDLKEGGNPTKPSRGLAMEKLAGSFTIPNARDRCLLNEARSFNVFQAIGHWLWIMGGRMDLASIQYYNPQAEAYSVDLRKLDGAYGPRLFGLGVMNQIPNVIELIKKRPSTRRAVVTVYIPEFDSHRTQVKGREDEVPCTVALQYLPRDGRLYGVTFMRSQDALMVLPYDVFIFTLLQEFVATSAGFEVGEYHHVAGSLHYYVGVEERLREVAHDETPPSVLMPEMPKGPNWKYLKRVQATEERIRVEVSAHLSLPGRTKFNPRDYLETAMELPDFWKTVLQCLVVWGGMRLGDEDILRRVHKDIAKPFDIYTERAMALISKKARRSLETFMEPLLETSESPDS